MSIEAAAKLWAEGDREGAFEALCAAWAKTSELALGELCELISELLVDERMRALARERSPEQVRASLIAAARAGDRTAVHALLPWLTELARPKGRQRLALLEPADPVLLRSLALWLRQRPELNELAQYLVARRSWWLEFQQLWLRRDAPLELDRFTRDSQQRLQFVRSPGALDPAEAGALAGLSATVEATLPAERGQARILLEAVREHPDDDAARALLADFLLSRNEHDPRGEFINLQLRAAAGQLPEHARARERALLDRHGFRWLGPLAYDCFAPSVRFERGFLAHVDLRRPVSRPPTFGSPGHPIWATVETLHGTNWTIAGDPIMRSLRTLGCDADCARALLSGPVRPRIEGLAVTFREWGWFNRYGVPEPDRVEELALARELFAGLDAIPNLRRLHLLDSITAGPDVWQWLWQGPRASLGSVRLRIDGNATPSLSQWSEQLRRDQSTVELLLDYGMLCLTLLPADGYRTVRVNHNVPHWRVRPSNDELLQLLVKALVPSLQPSGLRRIEIVGAHVDLQRLRELLRSSLGDADALEIVVV